MMNAETSMYIGSIIAARSNVSNREQVGRGICHHRIIYALALMANP